MSNDWNNQFNDTAKPIKKNSRNGVTEAANETRALTLRNTNSALSGAANALELLSNQRDNAVTQVAETVAALTSPELFMGDVMRKVAELQTESEPETTSFLDAESFFVVPDLAKYTPKCLQIPGSNSSESWSLKSADLDS